MYNISLKIAVFLNFLELFVFLAKGFSWKVVWLVGANSNVGEAMALELANSGAKLILSAKKTDILKEVKENCIGKTLRFVFTRKPNQISF